MRGTAISKRYGRAVFELARDESRTREVLDELGGVVELCSANPALQEVLYRPLHPAKERLAVWKQIAERMAVSPLVRNFCAYLINKARMDFLPHICEEVAVLVDEASGVSRGEVVAAAPLQEAELEQLRGALSARVGRELNLSVRVEPELIGGVVARVGDLVFDSSLKTQLQQLRCNLTKGS